MKIFEQLESEVRSYVRAFPVIFNTGKGSMLVDENENEYIDFFAGAGTLNYGHNNPKVSEALIEYIQKDGIIHGLDTATVAKKNFLEKFNSIILEPRHMDYKIQFPGPTGTNAVETALKLARKVKGRSGIIAFTNAFHGLTMGSMSITGNSFYKNESYITRNNVAFMPFDGYFGDEVDTSAYLRKYLEDKSSGVDLPAAIILETIQAEGGVNVCSDGWLRSIEQICRDFDILLIIDDIQVGNGRTGTFFSFEKSGINPDIVTLSKSIGGGLPLSMVLFKSSLDQWRPGEHSGTFRGNNLAFVASAQLLDYWKDSILSKAVAYKEAILKEKLEKIAKKYSSYNAAVRGRGMIFGLHFPEPGFCSEVSSAAFERGLVIELAGANKDVVKFLPPLIIEEELLRKGLDIVDQAIEAVIEIKQDMIRG